MNCQEVTEKLESLQILRIELGSAILAYKESQTKGDIAKTEELKQQARNLKIKLETGIKEMNKEMLLFVVSDTINPYAEALKEAGLPLDHPETKERKEMTLDIEEIIKEHIKLYREQDMPEWAEDIEENKELLLDILLDEEEKKKIEKRIKAGMIPIVMPGRDIQQQTWEKSLGELKPIWIPYGKEEKLAFTLIYEGYMEKMNSFLKCIPNRPYIVWIKPKQDVEWETVNLTFEDQKTLLQQLHKSNPDLVDKVDVIPTEYLALQSRYTREIQEKVRRYHKIISTPIQKITPLDYSRNNLRNSSKCRFLSVGLFSGDTAPSACFDRDFYQMYIGHDDGKADFNRGFRSVART